MFLSGVAKEEATRAAERNRDRCRMRSRKIANLGLCCREFQKRSREVLIIPVERKTNIVTPVRIARSTADAEPSSLVVIYGPLLARRWMLEKNEQTVGRSEGADIRLEDEGCRAFTLVFSSTRAEPG